MRIFLFILLSGVLIAAAPVWAQDETSAWDNSSTTVDRSIFAFVGQKNYVEKRNLDQFMDFELEDGRIIQRVIPRMSDRFEARYEILSQVEGDLEADTIDFVAYDHYGRPLFPMFKTALFFLINDDGEWVKQRQYYPVQRTTDGDWAKCGSLARDYYSEEINKLAASYEENIQVEHSIFRGERQIPKNENSAFCSTGTRAINIYKFEEHRSFGPLRRRNTCNREMGVSDGVNVGTGSGPNAKIKGAKHAACVERLEAKEGLLPH